MTGAPGLHVFVNRRRFDAAAGVTPRMTGAAIAALLGVPADNAVVEIEDGAGGWREVPLEPELALEPGMGFLVTRQFVMGGRPGAGS